MSKPDVWFYVLSQCRAICIHIWQVNKNPLKVNFVLFVLPERVWGPGTHTVVGTCCWRNAPPWRKVSEWANGSRASQNALWVWPTCCLICTHLKCSSLACFSLALLCQLWNFKVGGKHNYPYSASVLAPLYVNLILTFICAPLLWKLHPALYSRCTLNLQATAPKSSPRSISLPKTGISGLNNLTLRDRRAPREWSRALPQSFTSDCLFISKTALPFILTCTKCGSSIRGR